MPSNIVRTRRRRGIRFAKLTLTASWSVYDDQHVPPPDEDPPGTPEPWHAVAACRPDTAHARALRFIDLAGETLAAIILVVGGAGFTGIASLLGSVA